MKKSIIAVLVAAVLVASFGVVGSVYAKGGNPGNGYGVATQQQLQTEDGLGLYHDDIVAVFAEALDMTVEEIEAKIAEGFTIAQVAQAEGMTLEEIRALMPVGLYGVRNAGWMGRGFMAAGENAEFAQGPLYLGDGVCLEDGVPVQQYLNNQQGLARGRGW